MKRLTISRELTDGGSETAGSWREATRRAGADEPHAERAGGPEAAPVARQQAEERA